MAEDLVFDREHTVRLNEACRNVLSEFLPDLVATHGLRTAIDVGCGAGFYANYLSNLGLQTSALDARSENIAAAKRRFPQVDYYVRNVEDPNLPQLGLFDVVLCFGLLYHLENPFQAIRNLAALTGKILLVESIILFDERPLASLVEEGQGQDQSLRHVSFLPTESCLIGMLRHAGFETVYAHSRPPDHPDYSGSIIRRRKRTILVAARGELGSTELNALATSRRDPLLRGLPSKLRRITIPIPVILPERVYHWFVRWANQSRGGFHSRPFLMDLQGDRDVEWSWVLSRMPQGPGEALDFGATGSYLSLAAALRDFNVTAVDLQTTQWPFSHPRLAFRRGDLLKIDLPSAYFDLVINCSSVEHVGLAGRYSVIEGQPDGDLQAMERLWELMKPRGTMLLTIPVGQDAIFSPMHRVYGTKRLPKLLDGFLVEEEMFWIKERDNRWKPTNRETALSFKAGARSENPHDSIYALGCFVLRKPQEEDGSVPHLLAGR